MSDTSTSVSTWIERMKTGDQEAAARLWDLYFKRLLGWPEARLVPLRRQGAADEEDVVLSAFHDFYRAARGERYADLHGRGDLWRVLATFVANKAKTLIDRETADKRGGGRLRGDSVFGRPDSDSSGPQGFAQRRPASRIRPWPSNWRRSSSASSPASTTRRRKSRVCGSRDTAPRRLPNDCAWHRPRSAAECRSSVASSPKHSALMQKADGRGVGIPPSG